MPDNSGRKHTAAKTEALYAMAGIGREQGMEALSGRKPTTATDQKMLALSTGRHKIAPEFIDPENLCVLIPSSAPEIVSIYGAAYD